MKTDIINCPAIDTAKPLKCLTICPTGFVLPLSSDANPNVCIAEATCTADTKNIETLSTQLCVLKTDTVNCPGYIAGALKCRAACDATNPGTSVALPNLCVAASTCTALATATSVVCLTECPDEYVLPIAGASSNICISTVNCLKV